MTGKARFLGGRAGQRNSGMASPMMEEVRSRLLMMDMKALLEDVGPFLERPQDATLITRENLLGLLEQ